MGRISKIVIYKVTLKIGRRLYSLIVGSTPVILRIRNGLEQFFKIVDLKIAHLLWQLLKTVNLETANGEISVCRAVKLIFIGRF